MKSERFFPSVSAARSMTARCFLFARRFIITSRDMVLVLAIAFSCIHKQYTITYTHCQHNWGIGREVFGFSLHDAIVAGRALASIRELLSFRVSLTGASAKRREASSTVPLGDQRIESEFKRTARASRLSRLCTGRKSS